MDLNIQFLHKRTTFLMVKKDEYNAGRWPRALNGPNHVGLYTRKYRIRYGLHGPISMQLPQAFRIMASPWNLG